MPPTAADFARQDLCRFLAGCYYEPDAAFAEERLFESMHATAALLDADLAACATRLGQAFAATPLQELQVDYTRLFLGPVQARAQPYASVWLTGEATLMQDSTAAVQQLYRQGGFEIDEDFRDLPDHVAVELEFVYLLHHQINQARLHEDAEALAAAQVLRDSFLHGHLLPWLPAFTQALRAGAETAFYEALADFTEGLLKLLGPEADSNARTLDARH